MLPKIVIAADESLEPTAADLATALPLAWPDSGDAPEIVRHELTDLLEPGERTHGKAAVHVLLPGDDTPLAVLSRLVDALDALHAPALLLVGDAPKLRRQLTASGSCILPRRTPSSELGAAIYALCRRQPAVDRIGEELRIARTSSGGIKGEMNRIHEELHLASTVQRELMPKRLPKDADGLEFGVLYRPASYVSGDIYDVSWIDEHHIGFMLADAVGHGVPAALLTMIIARALVRTDETGAIIEPAEALSRLNCELVRWSMGGQRFATAVYGVIDVRTHEVRMAGAGHPPPLRMSGDELERIETDGALLGVFEDAPYDQATFTLEPGQTLLVYSDGFELAFPAIGGSAHERRLPTETYVSEFARFGFASGEGGEGVSKTMDRLAAAVDDQPGSLHQADDLTAIAIGANLRSAAMPKGGASAAA